MKSQTPIISKIILISWAAGNLGTLVYLIATDVPQFNIWNWTLFLPIDFMLAATWPGFWMWRLLF